MPFQAWKPDVYQGAPTPVTALMASCTLVAAFGALLRVFYVAFGSLTWDWRPMMWGIAILTMLGGSIVAITQTDVKRLLAYSSIAQAGYILTGVIAANTAGLSSSLFYLAAYGFATIGAFAVVTLIRNPGGEAGHMSSWAGLGKRSPLVAGIFALFLIAFAGIPLTSGFIGKFAVFQAAISGGAVPLVIVGALSSAILAFPYVKVIVLMFFSEPAADGPAVVKPSAFTASAVGDRRARDARTRHRARAAAQAGSRRRHSAVCTLGFHGGRRSDEGNEVINLVPVALSDAVLAADLAEGLAQVENGMRAGGQGHARSARRGLGLRDRRGRQAVPGHPRAARRPVRQSAR